MDVRLIVVGGKTRKTRVSLKLPATIGRSHDADLTIAHPMISRKHCEIFESEGLLRIRDLGSLNGTVVGDKAVGEAALRPNDEFTVGPLTFRVDYEYAGDPTAVVSSPPPSDMPVDTTVDDLPEAPVVEPELFQSDDREPGEIKEPGQSPAGNRQEAAVGPREGDEELAPVEPASFENTGGSAEECTPPQPVAGPLGFAPPDGQLPDFGAWMKAAGPAAGEGPSAQPSSPRAVRRRMPETDVAPPLCSTPPDPLTPAGADDDYVELDFAEVPDSSELPSASGAVGPPRLAPAAGQSDAESLSRGRSPPVAPGTPAGPGVLAEPLKKKGWWPFGKRKSPPPASDRASHSGPEPDFAEKTAGARPSRSAKKPPTPGGAPPPVPPPKGSDSELDDFLNSIQ